MSSPLNPPAINADKFLDGLEYRRSIYGLNDQSPISEARIKEITERVLQTIPSSYNTQTTRIILIFGAQHKKFWDVLTEAAKPVLMGAGEQVWKSMEPRFGAFKAAYGSALFYESGEALRAAQEAHKAAAHVLPQFTEHTSAMHQIALWTALELEGLGGNLQHLGSLPGVADALHKEFGFSKDWDLKAHLNFGGKAQPHPERPNKLDTSETLQILN